MRCCYLVPWLVAFSILWSARSCPPFLVKALVTSTSLTHPPRHVALLNSYEKTRGPYLYALLDQLVGQAQNSNDDGGDLVLRVAICYGVGAGNRERRAAQAKQRQQDLQNDFAPSLLLCGDDDGNDDHTTFQHENPLVICIDDYNPVDLKRELDSFRPNLVWVLSGYPNKEDHDQQNALQLRYSMRTSGLDRWIQANCGPTASATSCCVYVGEGRAATLVASASLDVAKVLLEGDSSSEATTVHPPEPQFFGLDLIGPNRAIVFGGAADATELNGAGTTTDSMLSDMTDQLSRNSKTQDLLSKGHIRILKDDKVWVWSQVATNVQSFVYCPARRGIIEDWLTGPQELTPLEALVEEDYGSLPLGLKKEGVSCYGEPSVDPSRQVQGGGDSEWLDG